VNRERSLNEDLGWEHEGKTTRFKDTAEEYEKREKKTPSWEEVQCNVQSVSEENRVACVHSLSLASSMTNKARPRGREG
jgi:hypothetical protein